MSYEAHLISPFVNSGLQKYFKPFIIGEDAFVELFDAYAWRGSVRKREGFELFGTIPTTPVMGIKTFITQGSLQSRVIAFSKTKSYSFNGGSFTDITQYAYNSTAFSWTGGNDDYFWSSNYAGSMWVTNNIDNIKYLTNIVPNSWSNFTPIVNLSGTIVNTALIVLPYKGRLVLLNTTEGGQSFPNRARWSQVGTPYGGMFAPIAISTITPGNPTTITSLTPTGIISGENVSFFGISGDGGKLNFVQTVATFVSPTSFTVPIDTTLLTPTGGFFQAQGNPPAPFSNDEQAWRDDITGRGGFNDADTSETIVSAGIVKDTLIVFFQRSTWRLRYTNNEILPFIWERLNTQYGSESTHSTISFDEHILTFSRFGWIKSDTNNVERIDLAIPDDAFNTESTDVSLTGLRRVQGIRDFFRQLAVWTYPEQGFEYPNQMYCYNYIDKSWSIFNPNLPQTPTPNNGLRVWGSFNNTSDKVWADYSVVGEDEWFRWTDPIEDTWSSPGGGVNFPFILAGDFTGKLYEIFDLIDGSTNDNGTNFGFSMVTKSFNPYLDRGLKCRLGYIDIYCGKNISGEITVNHIMDDASKISYSKIVSTDVEFGLSNSATAKYTRVFLGGIAHFHQIQITLSEAQIADPLIGTSGFELQAIVAWTQPAGRIRG